MTRAEHLGMVVVAVSFFAGVPVARAFIEADRFDAPAVEGGGGGLRFTGSRRDPRTCGVCHRGGAQHEVSVSGLPRGDAEPGLTYELVVDASAAARSAFVLELEGRDLAGLGSLDVPEESTLAPEEQCSNGVPATRIVDAEGGRRVAVADACGARRYRVLWTAPAASAMDPALTLHGGVVLADDSGGPTGDGAVVLESPIGNDARARTTPAQAGCSVAERRRGSGRATVLATAIAWLIALRLRRDRCARRGSRTRRAG